MEILINDPKETEEIAKLVGLSARAGDTIILSGDLGAGKTTMTKGIALGLGIEQMIKVLPIRSFVNIVKDDCRYIIWMFTVLRMARMI